MGRNASPLLPSEGVGLDWGWAGAWSNVGKGPDVAWGNWNMVWEITEGWSPVGGNDREEVLAPYGEGPLGRVDPGG